ncbi:MAG: transcriptional regulator with XRE-family HTH domain [Phenylobacterium sp.]|jgi:transcriptional regulator with XRE-family HTH domain
MMGKTVASEENAKLTAWLKDKRKEKGHTMRSLAQIIGTPHSFVGKIEHQERRLDVVEFMRYCTALEVDPGDAIKAITEG